LKKKVVNYVEGSHPAVLNTIRDKKSIDDDLKTSMREAIRRLQIDTLERDGQNGDGKRLN
jgi:hypothetical protein